MLTEPTFCRNSSINISIDNRYDNRFIYLGRPIFTVNHNGDCVHNSDYTWDCACACYTHEAPLTRSANWLSDHRYSTARFSYCSVNPLRLQWLYLLLVPPACWYKLNCNRFNDHERLFFFLNIGPRESAISSHWGAVIAGDCAMTIAFHVLQKCRMKISLQFISTFGRDIPLPLKYLGPVTFFSIRIYIVI